MPGPNLRHRPGSKDRPWPPGRAAAGTCCTRCGRWAAPWAPAQSQLLHRSHPGEPGPRLRSPAGVTGLPVRAPPHCCHLDPRTLADGQYNSTTDRNMPPQRRHLKMPEISLTWAGIGRPGRNGSQVRNNGRPAWFYLHSLRNPRMHLGFPRSPDAGGDHDEHGP